MRIKKSLILAGPALLTAVTLSPLVASPAQALAETSAASAQTSTHVAIAPPKKKKKATYNRGHMAGYADGRDDCKKKQPYTLRYSGGGPYQRGFADGYNSGYHSC
ncbi:hypothetical protein ACIBI9_49875 [Nonomuraea sp. NPDC050451]|uniref:hypothetical protein n=1 Tax=Nonomuraea sp. NPDC050451 TaxID=3364364 RepID=UPI0037873EDF